MVNFLDIEKRQTSQTIDHPQSGNAAQHSRKSQHMFARMVLQVVWMGQSGKEAEMMHSSYNPNMIVNIFQYRMSSQAKTQLIEF